LAPLICNLEYIPKHLHTDDKPVKDVFEIGEKIFYRCKPEILNKPYDNISLQDISHNRNFNDDENYGSENVFYNINEHDERIKYEGLNFIVFYIKNLSNNITYSKTINHNNLKAILTLKHTPEPCMYPHSVIEISINDIVVNKNNYSEILGKKSQTFSHLRGLIRQELTSIIQTGFIDTSKEIETIIEP
jgi:hypothetical protein